MSGDFESPDTLTFSMDLSIIIINYKSAHHVLACIESIYKETQKYSFEIIVVDNDSADGSQEKICSTFPNIIWIQSGYNAGFARANNIGIRQSIGENILILNADTIILENAVDKTIDLFKTKNDAVASGVQLLNPDGTHQISGAYFIKGGLNFLLPLPYLGRFIRYMGYKLKSKIPSIKSVPEDQEVDWIVGAFIIVKKSVLEKAGLFDEDFFMYVEEIEWCSRLRKQGKLYLFSSPKVIHLLGGSSSEYYDISDKEKGINIANKKGGQIIISNLLRVRKQYGIGWFMFNFFIYLFELPLFFCCLLINKLFAGKTKYQWADFFGYAKNLGILMKYFPKIFFNKRYFYKIY